MQEEYIHCPRVLSLDYAPSTRQQSLQKLDSHLSLCMPYIEPATHNIKHLDR